MNISYGNGETKFGPGVCITLSGTEVARAIDAYLYANGYYINGPRIIRVNDKLCVKGEVYVDPSGYVICNWGEKKWSGRGPDQINKDHFSKESIKKSENEVDWEYIDEYEKSLERNVK